MKKVITNEDISSPATVTFAGVDDAVRFEHLYEITRLYYEVEWGILAHPEKHGTPRYPSLGFISQFSNWVKSISDGLDGAVDDDIIPEDEQYRIYSSLHLCGGYVENLFELGYTGLEEYLGGFDKVQLNCSHLDLDKYPGWETLVKEWAQSYDVDIIQQVSSFPAEQGYFIYLLDSSKGKGITPNKWPAVNTEWSSDHAPRYAGGIGPHNVLEVAYKISQGTDRYALDMESKIRDDNNELDLDKVRMVCAKLYGSKIYENDGVVFANIPPLSEEIEVKDIVLPLGSSEPFDTYFTPTIRIPRLEYATLHKEAFDYLLHRPMKDRYYDSYGGAWKCTYQGMRSGRILSDIVRFDPSLDRIESI